MRMYIDLKIFNRMRLVLFFFFRFFLLFFSSCVLFVACFSFHFIFIFTFLFTKNLNKNCVCVYRFGLFVFFIHRRFGFPLLLFLSTIKLVFLFDM